MLRYLRKIRKSLIEQGSVRKYFLYAIGEIALVVVGILIALQINNWNESRKDRVKEESVLREISATLSENIVTLDAALGLLYRGNKSSEIVLRYLNQEIPYSDTLSHYFDRSRWSMTTLIEGVSNAGYRELEYVGYDIIENRKLRKEIVYYFDKSLKQLVAKFNRNNSGVFANYDAHTRKILVDIGGAHALPHDRDEILKDNFYRSIVTTIYDNRKGLIRSTIDFKRETKDLMESILSHFPIKN